MFKQISLKLCESANKQINPMPDPRGIHSKQMYNIYICFYIHICAQHTCIVCAYGGGVRDWVQSYSLTYQRYDIALPLNAARLFELVQSNTVFPRSLRIHRYAVVFK